MLLVWSARLRYVLRVILRDRYVLCYRTSKQVGSFPTTALQNYSCCNMKKKTAVAKCHSDFCSTYDRKYTLKNKTPEQAAVHYYPLYSVIQEYHLHTFFLNCCNIAKCFRVWKQDYCAMFWLVIMQKKGTKEPHAQRHNVWVLTAARVLAALLNSSSSPFSKGTCVSAWIWQ